MVAWAWNGLPYSWVTACSPAAAIAPDGSPRSAVVFHSLPSSMARYRPARVALETPALGPGAKVTASASAADLACQKRSATTATAPRSGTTAMTPGRLLTDEASDLSTAPPNIG